MLPVVASPLRVATEIVIYAWLTVLASLALWPLATGWVYGVLALLAGAAFLLAAHRLLARTRAGANAKAAMQLFHYSNSYLAFLFVAVAVDTLLR
jgi:protoheme IX farnesyltransferase